MCHINKKEIIIIFIFRLGNQGSKRCSVLQKESVKLKLKTSVDSKTCVCLFYYTSALCKSSPGMTSWT